jgi:hypothetical protein
MRTSTHSLNYAFKFILLYAKYELRIFRCPYETKRIDVIVEKKYIKQYFH